MAQIKIEITYDPSKEALEQAVSSLVPSTVGIDCNTLGEAVTQEVLARLRKTSSETIATEAVQSSEDKTNGADITSTDTDKASAPTGTEDQSAMDSASDQVNTPLFDPDSVKKVSKTDVRAIATALSKSGKREELSAIFAEFGGKKLSDIKEADYPALMERLVAANG